MEDSKSGSGKAAPAARAFDRVCARITHATGSAAAFFSAIGIVVAWAISGPFFDYSQTWQLFINTGTTIITFLMVFVIQQSANKDTTAIQLKLNELIACNAKASNHLIDVEHLTDKELQVLKKFYARLSMMADEKNDLYSTHSLDEAKKIEAEKEAVKSHKKSA